MLGHCTRLLSQQILLHVANYQVVLPTNNCTQQVLQRLLPRRAEVIFFELLPLPTSTSMEPSGACDARVVGPHDVLDPDVRVVNCTSKSKEAWCHGYRTRSLCSLGLPVSQRHSFLGWGLEA